MSGRTEHPTRRRLREARRRGDVPASRELTGLAALLAGGAVLFATGRSSAGRIAAHLRTALAAAASEPPPAPGAALALAVQTLATVAAPVVLAAVAGALACGFLQTGGMLAAGALAPRAERLNPARNLASVFSIARATDVLLGLAKATLAMGVAGLAARGAARAGAELPWHGAGALLVTLPRLLAPVLLWLLPLLAAFAAADLLLARARHRRALRMTREEVAREHKEDEGDPRHKAERRRRHRALLDVVPIARATCVVVNPTHLAVALYHRRDGDAAPLVVAKGAGAEAAAIRSAARRAGVAIVRDVALARALWRLADLGEEIPEELYEAAAAVLVHVHGLAPEPSP